MSEKVKLTKAKFMIAEPTMPTAEQHRQASLQWLKRVQPTLIDQWPAELHALSMPTTFVPIEDGVWDEICAIHDGEGFGPKLGALADRIDHICGWNRKFVRLNSRSPKDALFPFEVAATMSGKEAVSMLANSMRVMDDLMEFEYVPEQPAFVCLRDFVYGMRPDYEFRCFVKDGNLIAVTHYDYTKPTPDDIIENVPEIRATIDVFFAEKVKPVLPVQTVVFDLFFRGRNDPMVIEINPYGLSDPCWFGSYEAVEHSRGGIETSALAALTAQEKTG